MKRSLKNSDVVILLFLVWGLSIISVASADTRKNLALNNVVIKTVEDQKIRKGSPDSIDILDALKKNVTKHRPAISIVRVGNTPGTKDYQEGKDYKFGLYCIDWSPAGKEPAQGNDYYVTYQYVASENGHNTMAPGTNAVDGNTSAWRLIGSGFLYVDLKKDHEIRQIVLKLKKAIRKFSLMYAKDQGDKGPETWHAFQSSDGTWENPVGGLSNTEIILNTKPVEARYVKLQIHKGDQANDVTNLKEFEVYSVSDGSPSTTDIISKVKGVVKKCVKRPVIDGTASPGEWDNAMNIDSFTLIGADKPAVAVTTGKMAYDEKNLYIYLEMINHPATKPEHSLKRKYKNRDEKIWHDDSVEIQLDTNNDEKGFYHFTINSNGAWIDMYYHSPTQRNNVNWNCDIEAKAKIHPDKWTLEIAIPFTNLGVNSPENELWGINIRRINFIGKRDYSTWAKTYPSAITHPADKFNKVMFEAPVSSPVVILSKGDLSHDGNILGSNKFKFAVLPSGKISEIDCRITSRINNNITGRNAYNRKISGDTQVMVSVPYTVSGDENEQLNFEVSDEKGTLLHKSLHSAQVHDCKRVYEPVKPLFEELTTGEKNDPHYGKAIFWAHALIEKPCVTVAEKYGLEYDQKNVFSEHAEMNSYSLIKQPNKSLVEMFRVHSKRPGFLVYPDYRAFREKTLSWSFHPENQQEYFRQLNEELDDQTKFYSGLYTGDEFLCHTIRDGIKCLQNPEKYPFIKDVDREVKEKYGFGRFGMPRSISDTNPYRWIAYYRYCIDKFMEITRKNHDLVKGKRPEWLIVAEDPTAKIYPLEYSRQAPYVDVFTNQFVPHANPDRPALTFLCKFYADLTGKPFWPCVHLEEACKFGAKPSEVRMLLSQIFTGGGTGFHFWLKDSKGRGCTYFGSPKRWKAIKEVLKIAQEMNPLHFPEPDSLLFYSNRTYQSQCSNGAEVEYWFHLLGTYAGNWFKIVDENTLKEIDLKKFKTIFIPGGKYIDRETAKRFENYVIEGGTLVAGDPEIFSNYIDGEDAGSLREKLFGVKILGDKEKSESIICSPSKFWPGYVKPFSLKNPGNSCRIQVCNPETKILARFDDNTPAVVVKPNGKGKALYFAFQAGTSLNISNPHWRRFFEKLADGLGLKTKQDIWRFQFPKLESEQKTGTNRTLCLTGNYLQFIDDTPVKSNNLTVKGHYSYDIAPDSIADEGGVKNISFKDGDLTDRFQALSTSGKRSGKFITRWKKLDTPLSVTFDLTKEFKVDKVKIFYSGCIDKVNIQVSNDGKTFTNFSTIEDVPTTKGVLSITGKCLNPLPARFVKLIFTPNNNNNTLALIEVEIWGM